MSKIKCENIDVFNWHNAIRGMRNSWESWDKMDSYYKWDTNTIDLKAPEWIFGAGDWELALKLAKAGSDHGKFLRQIMISVDIIAGNEWWKEFDTYKVGTVANSTSMMHKMGSRELTADDFSFDDPNHPYVTAVLDIVNAAIRQWHESGKKVRTPEWRLMQKLVPMGFIYRRTVTMNYQVLRNIYHSQRRFHRLQEWRDFCTWMETLPYSELITAKVGE